MNSRADNPRGWTVMERVYEDGLLKQQRPVATAANFAEGAEKIARLEKFRSVLDWRDWIYTLEPTPVGHGQRAA